MRQFFESFQLNIIGKIDVNIIKSMSSINIILNMGKCMFILLIIDFIFSTPFELPLFYFWQYNNISDGLFVSWPIFLWAFVVTLCILLLVNKKTLETKDDFYGRLTNDESSLFQCFIISLLIGIVEELIYRWLSFYLSILGTKIMNYCLFGLCRWFYLYLEAPFINIIFLKQLEWLLYDQAHWSIGAAALIANAKFRDGHVYLGLFSYYNSWCIGFFSILDND